MTRITEADLPAGLIDAMRHVQRYIDRSGLDARLLELMRTRVSQINSCAYCLDMHHKLALHAGETVQRLISVSAWREAPYYSKKEQAVLAFAERLTHLPAEADNENLHDELLQHFTKPEIALLSLAVAQINSWNRLMCSFATVAGNFKVPEGV
jgi:AhpD family alkylhydroperoxidase